MAFVIEKSIALVLRDEKLNLVIRWQHSDRELSFF